MLSQDPWGGRQKVLSEIQKLSVCQTNRIRSNDPLARDHDYGRFPTDWAIAFLALWRAGRLAPNLSGRALSRLRRAEAQIGSGSAST